MVQRRTLGLIVLRGADGDRRRVSPDEHDGRWDWLPPPIVSSVRRVSMVRLVWADLGTGSAEGRPVRGLASRMRATPSGTMGERDRGRRRRRASPHCCPRQLPGAMRSRPGDPLRSRPVTYSPSGS